MDYLLQLDPTGTCCDCPSRSSPCDSCGGACCNNGICTTLTRAACLAIGGNYLGDLTSCVGRNCNNGACCSDEANCTTGTQSDCTNVAGHYLGNGTNCTGINCAQGACCTLNICSTTNSGGCIAGGGTYQGDGTNCTPNPCPSNVATGACCSSGVCDIETQANCTNAGRAYQGDNTTCSPNPCTQSCGACSTFLAYDGSGRKFKTQTVVVSVTETNTQPPPHCTLTYSGTEVVSCGSATCSGSGMYNDIGCGSGTLSVTTHASPAGCCIPTGTLVCGNCPRPGGCVPSLAECPATFASYFTGLTTHVVSATHEYRSCASGSDGCRVDLYLSDECT